MAINKIEMQDENGNIYYPHTDATVVFLQDGSNVQTVIGNVTTLLDTINGEVI